MRDVVVIGAGPAGSTAALRFARAGWSVTLIEQHRFPRDKVCGECLGALGIDALDRMGLAHGLRRMRPVVLTHVTIHRGSGHQVRLRLPRPTWGISRRVLDQFLLDSARAAGVRIRQPARCENLETEPLRLRIRDLESNQLETLEPEQVIVADGKGSMLKTPQRTGDFGIKAHFENIDGPRDTIELFGCDGLYGGLAAIEGGRWNAAFSVPGRRLRAHKGNIAELFTEIVDENRMLAHRLAGARRITDWLASPLPRFAVTDHWPPGVTPVGNAAAAIEPIGGEGLGLAIRSAELAAEHLLHREGNLLDQYQRIWNVRSFACRTAARVVSNPLARTLLPLLRMPGAGGMSLHLLGK